MATLSSLQPREEAPAGIQQLVGPFLLGIVINYFLWGIQVAQSYQYYKKYRATDPLWTKTAVVIVFLADSAQSICTSHASWKFMVEGWGDPNLVNEVLGWGVNFMAFTDTVTVLLVHCFYARVVWRLFVRPYNIIFTGIILALSFTQLSAGIGQTAFMTSIHITLSEFHRIRTWVFVWVIPASLCDIIITTLLSMKLSSSRTGIKRTDDILTKLVRLTVETGLATSVVQIVDLIVYLIWPVTPYHAVLTFMAPKVYSNSILALLNSRETQDTAGNPSLHWDSYRDNQSGNIHVHTSKTISRSKDFELGVRKEVWETSTLDADPVIEVKGSSSFIDERLNCDV